MPKMKTRKAAAKRYKVTGSGKVAFKKQGLRHILTKKATKRKRNLRKTVTADVTNVAKIKKLVPYK